MFPHNLKLEALNLALAIQRLNVERVDEPTDAQSLVDEAEVIHAYLSKT